MGDADKVGKEFIQVQLRLGRREEAAAPKIRDCCMQDDEVILIIHMNNKPIRVHLVELKGTIHRVEKVLC